MCQAGLVQTTGLGTGRVGDVAVECCGGLGIEVDAVVGCALGVLECAGVVGGDDGFDAGGRGEGENFVEGAEDGVSIVSMALAV